ncbi:hypothetical protein RD792_015927 [Penstemon davidsonii]|uniref:Uncharacterized protein n=1 Tax=Penstemon davidsonii TaxID=160366 RepID=A0ABR0CIH4_9LAMI|nr:hypothetical protein RD792_015927 [Penstemon davidsonii]
MAIWGFVRTVISAENGVQAYTRLILDHQNPYPRTLKDALIVSANTKTLSFGSMPTSERATSVDPLLMDLNEKKQSFRRNVVSLAAELKDMRGRLASKEQSFAKETQTRQAWFLKLSSK